MKYTKKFLRAARELAKLETVHRRHKMGFLCQWILESNRGHSALAKVHNFAGLKYREIYEDVDWACHVHMKVPSEEDYVDFAGFRSPEHFVEGFLMFLSRPFYENWRETTSTLGYLRYVKDSGYATDPEYVQKTFGVFGEADRILRDIEKEDEEPKMTEPTWWRLYSNDDMPVAVAYDGSEPLFKVFIKDTLDLAALAEHYGRDNVLFAPPNHSVPDVPTKELDDQDKPPVADPAPPRPNIIQKHTPNRSPRHGEITKIVMHYTTTSSAQSTISWFANPDARVSAHFLVGRDGTIYQFCNVPQERAWHARGHNDDSIGIEHAAAPGQRLSAKQEQATIKLCLWLQDEYGPGLEIAGHNWLSGNSTSCPGDLWKSQAELTAWAKEHGIIH